MSDALNRAIQINEDRRLVLRGCPQADGATSLGGGMVALGHNESYTCSRCITTNYESDWVLSLEVGEHVPSRYEDMYLRNLHAHNCKGIILSWGCGVVPVSQLSQFSKTGRKVSGW